MLTIRFVWLVPQGRDGEATVVIGIGCAVGFAQELETVHGIFGVTGTISEGPAALVAQGVDHSHTNRLFEAFELAQNDGAMRPRTGERHVKMITAALGFVRRGAVMLYPIAERIFLASEFAGLGLFFGKLCHRFGV